MLNSGLLSISKEGLLELLSDLDIDAMIRGEKLSLNDFINISNKIV